MNKCWIVISGRLFVDMFYCHTKEQAIKLAWDKWGNPKIYTKTSNGNYEAIEA